MFHRSQRIHNITGKSGFPGYFCWIVDSLLFSYPRLFHCDCYLLPCDGCGLPTYGIMDLIWHCLDKLIMWIAGVKGTDGRNNWTTNNSSAPSIPLSSVTHSPLSLSLSLLIVPGLLIDQWFESIQPCKWMLTFPRRPIVRHQHKSHSRFFRSLCHSTRRWPEIINPSFVTLCWGSWHWGMVVLAEGFAKGNS